MRLLVLLLCWLLRRRLDLAELLQPDDLWRRALRHAPAGDAARPHRVPFAIGTLYLILVVAAAAVTVLAWQSLGFLATGVLALALFMISTGMPGWRKPLEAYTQAWKSGDISGAWREVQHLLPVSERAQATAPETLHLLLAETLIVQTFERYFLPLFWYAVAGPAGIVLAAGAVGLRNHYPGSAVRQLFERWCRVLGWLPAQLLSLTFGLAGDLAGWIHGRKARPLTRRNYGLTHSAGSALSSYALDPRGFEAHHPRDWTDFAERSLLAVRDLLNRSMWIWICLAALASLMGLIP